MENNVDTAPKDIRTVPLQEEISQRARQIWEASGKPAGRDDEFWLQAEREVLGSDPTVRVEGTGAVDSKQYTQATDANGAKSKRGRKK